MQKLAYEIWTAAAWLDAGRPFGRIVDRLREFDVVGAKPLDCRGRVLREAGEITPIAFGLRRRKHVLNEVWVNAVDCRHADIGRRPARVAASSSFGCFVD